MSEYLQKILGDFPMNISFYEDETLSQLERTLIHLERFKTEVIKPFYELYESALKDLQAATGLGHHFQDNDGIVYQLEKPTGTFVAFPEVKLSRTRYPDETKGGLSLTAARALEDCARWLKG